MGFFFVPPASFAALHIVIAVIFVASSMDAFAQSIQTIFKETYGQTNPAPSPRREPLTEREKAEREERRRLAAERDVKQKHEAQQKAQQAAEERAQAQAAVRQAAVERAERARADLETKRRLAAEQAEKRKLEAQQKTQRENDARALAQAASRQVASDRAQRDAASSTLSSPKVDDPLMRFDGAWVPTSPPGPQLFFNKVALGGRVVNLPTLGQAAIRVSNGESGSNFQISGQGFNCFYAVVFLKGNQRMIWDLRAGDPVCMPSNAYEQVE